MSFEKSKCINRVALLVLNSKNRLYNWIFKIIFITDLDSLPKNEKMKERRKGGMKEKKVKKNEEKMERKFL